MARKTLSDYRKALTTNYRSVELLLLLRVRRTSRLRIGVQSAKYYKQRSARGLLNYAIGHHVALPPPKMRMGINKKRRALDSHIEEL